MAYLCQHMEVGTDRYRMVGILPATARLTKTEGLPRPVELALTEPCWLGPPGTAVRGYLDGSWQLEPEGALINCAADLDLPYAIVKSCRAIGSQVQLNFAAQPHLLPRFFCCAATPSDTADPWRTT